MRPTGSLALTDTGQAEGAELTKRKKKGDNEDKQGGRENVPEVHQRASPLSCKASGSLESAI